MYIYSAISEYNPIYWAVILSLQSLWTRSGEAARIEKHGGIVHTEEGGVPRLYAEYAGVDLAMSRAFGDFELMQYGLISVPEISYHQITQRDEFIIVATDGVSSTFGKWIKC